MEALSNLIATCSSTALGRDVAAAAFPLSPLALRRIDFASLGPSNQPPNGSDGVVFGQQEGSGSAASGQAAGQAEALARSGRKKRIWIAA